MKPPGSRQPRGHRGVVEKKSLWSRLTEPRTALDRLDSISNLVAIAAFLTALVCLHTEAYSTGLVAQLVGIGAIVVGRVARWADAQHTVRPH